MINYHLQSREVGTGVSYGAIANNEHARNAVLQACQQLSPGSTVGSVLLFLTSAYAHSPQQAIKEAAIAAGTPQIFGCCAKGLLTEKEWLLDAEGAVAMAFPQEISMRALNVVQQQGINPKKILTLTTPNAATIAVNTANIAQIGSITTDEYGHGPFAVWQSGRIVEQEFSISAFPNNLEQVIKIADGIKRISPIMQINRAEGHCLNEIGEQGAVANLLSNLPDNLQTIGLKEPYGLLCGVSENNDRASIENGHYKLHHIVSSHNQKQQIHLSGSAKAGRFAFWAIRDQHYAQQTLKEQLLKARNELTTPPKFGLMFPNIGRGAEFFNGTDQDLELFKEVFPNVPLIGFYGNGEIAPGHKLSGLIHRYSTVFSLFA